MFNTNTNNKNRGLQSVACIEWTNVFSVDINLMQEKGRGKEGGQEHLVSFCFVCYSIFSIFLTFHFVKKGRDEEECKRETARKDRVNPQISRL